MAGVAGPRPPELGLARLPFHDELAVLRQVLPPARREILLGIRAALTGLQQLHPSDFAFLHFSTHAVVDSRQPALSRIALSVSDGSPRLPSPFLRTSQLAALGLNGSTVVLAACETAVGKDLAGEGVAGFTAALFQAGAAHAVVAGTAIDAASASAFLGLFYRQIFAARPASTEHAARLARVELSRSARWSDPYYWASFSVHGRPTRN
jgi:CHAT domain-containing protein